MTYIQLVNAVLRKLREDSIQTIQETEYSVLISDFVNDALTYVESSWDWSNLRETLVITTVDGTDTYPLTGFGNTSEIMSVYNVTDSIQIQPRSKAYIVDKQYKSTDTAKPRYYALNGTDVNNDINLVTYPKPDGAYTLEVNAVVRNKVLVDDADTTKLPTLPIIQLAFAYALREKGETGGQSASEQIVIADRDLSNAIALDSANNAGELIWSYV